MKRLMTGDGLNVTMGVLVTLLGSACGSMPEPGDITPASGNAQEQALPTERAVILGSPGGLAQFTITGSAADFGSYVALGEATFVPGQQEGVPFEGTGVAVLTAENRDRIVADVTCKETNEGFDFTFHWRDSVTFSTGLTVSNTGAFVDQKPPGLALTSIAGRSYSGASDFHCEYMCCTTCEGYVCKYQGCRTVCIPYGSDWPAGCVFRY